MRTMLGCLVLIFIATSGFAHAQEPFLIDTTIVYSPSGGRVPSVAFDGTNYLVMWGKGPDGTRVSTSMTILDPACIKLSPNPVESGVTYQTAAFGGDGKYIVTWERNTNINQQPDEIYFSRVSVSGEILDDPGIRIREANITRWPFAAFADDTWMIAWCEYLSGNWKLVAKRISLDGQVLDSTPIEINTGNAKYPCVGFDGENWFCVWSHADGGIYGARVTTSGVVLDPVAIQISASGIKPVLDFDGTNYLVVWENNDIYGARVAPDGTVLDPSGIHICAASSDQENPYVVFGDTSYLVVWQDERNGGVVECDIYGARVNTAGTVLDPAGIPVCNAASYQRDPGIAFDGTNWLVSWEDHITGEFGIYGTRVSQDGTVLDPDAVPISLKVNNQDFSSVVYNGLNYFAVWQDWRSGNYDICGARVNNTGQILDSPPIQICPDSGRQWEPAVASGAASNLVVWSDDRDIQIYGKRVSFSGVVLDSSPLPIGTGSGYRIFPDIANDGENWLCVWQDGRYGVMNYRIYGTRVTAEGGVLDPSGILIGIANGCQNPSVAFGNNIYFVVWEAIWAIKCYGARVTVDGTVLDPSGIYLGYTPMTNASPSVASDGTNFLVAFCASALDSNSVWGASDIHGTLVSAEGTVLDTVVICHDHDIAMKNPAVCYDGTDFVVLWQDDRNGDWDIYGARVNSACAVTDSLEVIILPGDQTLPELGTGASGQLFVSFSGLADEPYNTTRIWGSLSSILGIEEPEDGGAAQDVVLFAAPNPFNGNIEIGFSTEHRVNSAELAVYDITGRLIRQWDDATINLSNHVVWDGTDERGNEVQNGVYFCRIAVSTAGSTESYYSTRKIMRLQQF